MEVREIESSENRDSAMKLIKLLCLVCRFVLGLSKGNPGAFNSSSLSTRKVLCTSKYVFEYMTQEFANT